VKAVEQAQVDTLFLVDAHGSPYALALDILESAREDTTTRTSSDQVHALVSCRVRKAKPRLFRLDDEIYEDIMATFPELAEPPHDKLVKLDEDRMKSAEGKEKWRKFIQG
jgi:hypothetical protein